MNFRILKALLRKEFILMRRNPIIPKIILVMPVMVMLILPLVANLDVRDVTVTVVDNDHSQLSRRIIADLSAAESITVTNLCSNHFEAMLTLEDGSADAILSIPFRFERDLALTRPHLSIESNGVNATKGMLGARYVAESVSKSLAEWSAAKGEPFPQSAVSVINRYNPTLSFRDYMIPALMVVLLIIICGFLPALNLVNEKETGTLEAINVSPVSRLTFVLSKLIPFWIVGMFVITAGIIIGWLVYGLVPAGSLWAIYLAGVLFSLVMSGLGVTIANTSTTMVQSIFVMFAFIMIFQLMSGLFTPILSMPLWAQYITYLIPPRYFIEIMRSVYLKGTSVSELSSQYLTLCLFAAGLLLLAARTYRKQS